MMPPLGPTGTIIATTAAESCFLPHGAFEFDGHVVRGCAANRLELPGILRAIKEQRRAALAVASRNAARERHEKREAVLHSAQAERPRRKKSGRLDRPGG
jgi:hypothetical protein